MIIQLAKYFETKVSTTVNSLSVTFVCHVLAPPSTIVDTFTTPSSEIIIKLIRSTTSISANDPLPLALLHKLAYVLEMHIHAFINQSFNDLILPESMKTASISPIKDLKGD